MPKHALGTHNIILYKFYCNKNGHSNYFFKHFILESRSSPLHFEMETVHLKNRI